ncbi:hypothetical protein SDC9_198546 [bioreactor metagenome]|uniref:Uncharacterized protein n=1 Tax=bioreactor metagenome TaxID=1076179 RepID=A0A645IIU3_9ZZZZ
MRRAANETADGVRAHDKGILHDPVYAGKPLKERQRKRGTDGTGKHHDKEKPGDGVQPAFPAEIGKPIPHVV